MADILNPNWSRWIFASLTNHFDGLRQSFPFYIEGQNREDTISSFAEFRSNGPYFNEVSKNYWNVSLLAAIIIQIVSNDIDIHRLERTIGIFASAFSPYIDLFKYGDGVDDDQSKFGCLYIDSPIRIDKFGQTRVAVPVVQASLEAEYKTSFTT